MDDYFQVTPVPRRPNDHAGAAVHAHLRMLIMNGVLQPGTTLNQVELAQRLGVSRTPLREAIRMLQEEGLVDAEPQKRARVADFDPEHLEAVYVQRVLLEGLAAGITAARASDELLADLTRRLEEMHELARRRRHDGSIDLMQLWQESHHAFHLGLVSGVSSQLRRAINSNMERGERYRSLYQAGGPRSWEAANEEHQAIVEAFRAREADEASRRLAAHLTRTALMLIAQHAPAYDPVAVRAALGAAPPV